MQICIKILSHHNILQNPFIRHLLTKLHPMYTKTSVQIIKYRQTDSIKIAKKAAATK